MSLRVILTCEHASNAIPEAYQYLFEHGEKDLNSHRGWDPGALAIMTKLAAKLQAVSFQYAYTRLLIEPNRSLDHQQLFSKYAQPLDQHSRHELIEQYYIPYRASVEKEIARTVKASFKVLHLSIHSFTPVWDGVTRLTDIGILFDPKRAMEVDFSILLNKALKNRSGKLKVHDNQPYFGTDDGFTTHLRTKFGDDDYAGIELEVNQRLIEDGFESIKHLIGEAVTTAVNEYDNRRKGD